MYHADHNIFTKETDPMKIVTRFLLSSLLAILTSQITLHASEITYELTGTSTVPESWGFGEGRHPFVLNVTYAG